MADNTLPRVVVPFAFIAANTDNPGLKDFSPAVLPSDAPEEEDTRTSANGGEAGDGADPKVSPSSVPASVPTSHPSSAEGATPESQETPAPAEKDSPTKDKAPTE